MANNFSLNELKSDAVETVETTNNEGLLDTSTTELYTGKITSDEAAVSSEFIPRSENVEELNIADIKPYKEKTSITQENMDKLFGDLDAAIERDMEKITDLKNGVLEKEFVDQLDGENNEDIDVPESEDTLNFAAPAEEPATVEEKEVKNVDLSIDEDDFFKDIDGNEDVDEEVDEETEKQIQEIKASIKEKITPINKSIDLSKFTISKKAVSITKLLSMETPNANTADWVLYSSKQPISVSELSGPEIEKLNPNNSSRNRLNTYKDIYNILYKHVVDANKPEFEAWLKTLKFFDINHIYFAFYKACFAGTNSVPYSCPECNKMFMIDIDFEKMVKYATPEVKEEVAKILAGDTTSSGDAYEVELKQISDNYVVALKEPTVYEVIFETSSLPEDFTDKYKDLLGIISYIDGFYMIDAENNSLNPIDTKPDKDNMVKTAMRKIKIYYEILSTLTSDQYYQLTSYIKEINDNSEKVSYVLPEVTCPKCNHLIPEEARTPESLLFTRHQLAAIANI